MKKVEIKAPIQSLINEINVEIGQKVSPEEILLVFEVMKTRNELPSEVSGSVKEILVEVNDLVETDQVLMIIETDE